MKQVIVIHGGTTFEDYDDYTKYLATKPISLERFAYKPMWKELLQEKLGHDYQVLLPSMPNKTNARYSEWEIWFKHLTELFTDDCILIGHSMGGIFLAKYLSKHKFPVKIKATILIAAPYEDATEEDLTDFKLDAISALFVSQAGETTLFFGSDDPVIVMSEVEKYRHNLPDASFNIMSAPDHFMRAEFPELIQHIRSVSD